MSGADAQSAPSHLVHPDFPLRSQDTVVYRISPTTAETKWTI